MKTLFVSLVFVALSTPALALDSAFKTTADSISAAADKFAKEETASAKLYTGVKGWPSGSAILVRVYLSN